MSGIEIFISIILLATFITAAIKLGKHLANKAFFNRNKKDKILKDIQDALQAGLDRINASNMTATEVKKVKGQKDKFLSKAHQLVSQIAEISNSKLVKKELVDKILSEQVTIQCIEQLDSKYSGDYAFALGLITELIENTKFPTKEDYIQLNVLYKKYKKLNRDNRNA